MRYKDESQPLREEQLMRSLSSKVCPSALERAVKTLPPGTGLLITAIVSLLIWACIAGIFVIA